MKYVVETENLCKSYGSKNNLVQILKGINLQIEEGRFVSIMGPSGSGKSTLLYLLGALEDIDEGKVCIYGKDLRNMSDSEKSRVRRQDLGFVFQFYNLVPTLTVKENVLMTIALDNKKIKKYTEDAEKWLEAVGLKDHMNHKPGELSGGQQQRVAIARTLALDPAIILFDEPMSALDVATRLSLRRELKSIQQRLGTTMIYITHDQEEAFAMSDRIMVMGNARIHQIGTPDELLDSPADDYVRSFVIDNLRAKIDSLARYMR